MLKRLTKKQVNTRMFLEIICIVSVLAFEELVEKCYTKVKLKETLPQSIHFLQCD
jgi:hypothetical protein